MKQISKRLFSAFLAIVMFFSMLPNITFKASAIAAAQNTYAAGDTINFGTYPQTKVIDESLISKLNSQTLQADNTVTYGGSKYLLVYFTKYTATSALISDTLDITYSYQDDNGYYINTVYWFKFEPIQWRVLSNTDGELFVVAEKILVSRAYDQEKRNVTWEYCSLRTWLNDNFYNAAFSSAEKSCILTSVVVNENNPWQGTNGGNNTDDKLFLLKHTDTINTSYGFSSSYSNSDTARRAQGTDFAKSNGLWISTVSPYSGNSEWWLRSPGPMPEFAGTIKETGNVEYNYRSAYNTFVGVRPMCKLNLSSWIITSKSGTNCVIDKVDHFIYGLEAGTASLEDYVNVTPGFELTYVPDTVSFGTGTIVNLTLDGITVERYKIVIYGDVNGDGNITGLDAGTMVNVENYMTVWDPVTDTALTKAGDLNADGNITGIDAGIVADVENYMRSIDQTTGLAT